MQARTKPDLKRAVAYVRTSTDGQHLGVEAQQHAIRKWAEKHGITVVAVHIEAGASGAAPLERRPVLARALEDLRAQGAGALIVHRRCRLARDVVVAAVVERICERHGARVLCAEGGGNGDGPEATLLRTIVDAVAAFERATIAARIRAALQAKRRKGERAGAVPFGWRLHADGVHLELDADEQRVVDIVKRMRRAGHTYPEIKQELEERGHAPRRGGSWYATQLRRIFLYEPASSA